MVWLIAYLSFNWGCMIGALIGANHKLLQWRALVLIAIAPIWLPICLLRAAISRLDSILPG